MGTKLSLRPDCSRQAANPHFWRKDLMSPNSRWPDPQLHTNCVSTGAAKGCRGVLGIRTSGKAPGASSQCLRQHTVLGAGPRGRAAPLLCATAAGKTCPAAAAWVPAGTHAHRELTAWEGACGDRRRHGMGKGSPAATVRGLGAQDREAQRCPSVPATPP